jgi:riboflavin synthase
MFTGIIEEIGNVVNIRRSSDSAILSINCSKVLENTEIGDSIAVNGVCLTVVTLENQIFTADISYETLNKSSMKNITKGSKVNLERALTLNTRLGGHLVSGHVDAVGTIKTIKEISNSYILSVEFPSSINKYISKKGSICIDGISLTVADIHSNILEVAVIPHTFENTILKYKKSGSTVNIEVDLLARYLEKLIYNQDSNLNEKLQQLGDLEEF